MHKNPKFFLNLAYYICPFELQQQEIHRKALGNLFFSPTDHRLSVFACLIKDLRALKNAANSSPIGFFW
jgi:hypothetical protein